VGRIERGTRARVSCSGRDRRVHSAACGVMACIRNPWLTVRGPRPAPSPPPGAARAEGRPIVATTSQARIPQLDEIEVAQQGLGLAHGQCEGIETLLLSVIAEQGEQGKESEDGR
jgi:hypothetical protein